MALDATSVIADFGPGKGVVAGVATDIVDRGATDRPNGGVPRSSRQCALVGLIAVSGSSPMSAERV